MCYGATCPTCSKRSWRGCGNHIPSVLGSVPEEQWCTCEPRVAFGGREYPPAAKFSMGGGWFGGLIGRKETKKVEKKDEGKEEDGLGKGEL